MIYIANKVCCFRGKKFRKGEEIPEDMIEAGKIGKLEKMGVISGIPKKTTGLPVKESGDWKQISFSDEELVALFSTLQENADGAKEAVSQISSVPVLLMLENVEMRKSVKESILARKNELEAGFENQAAE